ncbi:DUF5994 family protein [Streptomyces sp. NPDC020096]
MDSARVSFVPAGTDHHRLDGAWWPRSRDLPSELPALIAALDLRFGRIGRVTVNSSMWPEVPRRIAVAGRTIRVGWFTSEQDPNEICLLPVQGGRWDLLVVPPACEFSVAVRLMAAASAPLNRQPASAMLAEAADGRKAPTPECTAQAVRVLGDGTRLPELVPTVPAVP